METDTNAQGDVLKILVLEDSARDFELISEQLHDVGLTVQITWVETEDAFIAALRENQYDIILSDFKLPGFDAFGALRISNETCPEVPLICVSGTIGEETAIELLKLGAVDYVLKDRPERLPFAIKRAIDEAKGKKLRKNAQEALLANYVLLRIAGTNAKLGGWSVDLATNIPVWSDEVADIHEMPHGYVPGVTEAISFYAPEWQDRIRQVFSDCAEQGIPYDEEMEIITRTGRRVWVRTTGEALKNEEGKIIKVQGSFQDITERKLSIRALQEANTKLQTSQKATLNILEDLEVEIKTRTAREAELKKVITAIEQAGEIIIITDPAGNIEYINPAFTTVSGYSSKEVIGKTPAILKSGQQDTAFYQNLWETITSGEIWHGRIINKRKDGKLYTEDATISPVFDAAGKIINFVGVKRDITAELVLMEQFQQAQKMESVGRLAGGVAHDYNNMLAVILGYTGMALKKVAPSDPLHNDLRQIFEAASRSAEITRQLLAFARKQAIAPVVLDLNTTVDSMLKMLRHLIGENISLAWMPAYEVWPVKIDPSQLDQILANLCVNGRDAIDGVGKITIETANVIFNDAYCDRNVGFTPGAFVMLAVSDSGCGMDKNTLEQIFEPFFTTKEIGKGTGLGLATVYGIVKQNRGFINVYSEPGNGTTFKIFIPRETTGIVETKDSSEAETLLGGSETILLVEDESILLVMVKRLLESLGYTVLSAAGSGEALRMAEDHQGEIHLLLTDLIMPEMNGRDLALQLAALCPSMKQLFMSGYTADVITHQGILDEGVEFIQKPMSLMDLAAKVRKVLDTLSIP
ncbi:MAG: signal transduction histidine kinase nitrogen specific [Desulfobulbaceae bacterium]|nr:MAG: signal transduction histidine kinase nitrogen specific [Desulfobulbaceae bacterium]